MKFYLFAFLAFALMAGCNQDGVGKSESAGTKAHEASIAYDRNSEFSYEEKAAEIGSENIFIKNYMAESYAGFNASYGCWFLDEETESYIRYCMEVKRVHDVRIKGKNHKFFEVNGLYVNEKGRVDPDDAPHVAPGMSGFFVFVEKDGKWNLVSKIPEFKSETWGKSGVDENSFTQFGPEVYGWKITDGGMWQGQAIENLFFLAFIDGKLSLILEFPVSYNADGYGNQELIDKNFDNKIEIDRLKVENDLFVINLNHKSKNIEGTFNLIYDVNKREFKYPDELKTMIN